MDNENLDIEIDEEMRQAEEEYMREFEGEPEEDNEETTQQYLERVQKEYAQNNIIKHEHKNIDDLPNSISMGTEGKLGTVKVYFNPMDITDAEQRILNSLKLRKFMRDKEKEIEGMQ